MISITRNFVVTLILLVSAIYASCGVAFAQEPPAGYALYRVASAQSRTAGKDKAPLLIFADSRSGKVVANIVFSDTCSETTTFEWTFDKDIRFLRPEETFTATILASVSGDCSWYSRPYAMAYGAGTTITKEIWEALSQKEREELSGMQWVTKPMRVHGKAKDKPELVVGTGTTKFKALGNMPDSPGLWVSISFNAQNAGSNPEYFNWQVVYLYRAIGNTTPPRDDEIDFEHPWPKGEKRPEGTPVSTGGSQPDPGETDPPSTPTTGDPPEPSTPDPREGGTFADPCLDPAVQRCIDQWLEKAVDIRNRRQSDRAPWSISKYGHFVNNLVTAVNPPDGWATTYYSSKYCWIWIRHPIEHDMPVYAGDLPPLRDFVARCQDSGGGAVDPGSTGRGSSGNGNTGPSPDPVRTDERTLQALRRTVDVGERVLVPVYLLNPDGVANVNFDVTYDSAVAVADGEVVKGSLLEAARQESNSTAAGKIRIGFAQKKPLSRDGIVAYLPFKAVGQPGDKTPLTLSVSDIDDAQGADLPIQLIHGEIEIRGAEQDSLGDCDGDGVLTVADAICALKMSVGLMTVDQSLDISADGQVTSADARVILQEIP